jgi:hypothetical protein
MGVRMNIDNWNWAVWVIVVLHALAWFGHCALHGRPRTEPFNGWSYTVATLLTMWLFYCAGLFE